MAKLTLTDLTKIDSTAVTSINSNNSATETALENTLSRDGTSPNSMSAELDMNSYSIINGGTGNFSSIKLDGTTLVAGDTLSVTPSFEDDEFEVKDNADNTKILQFQLSGITTGTTRTVTWPDVSGTVLMSSDADVEDLSFSIYDDGDNTKITKFDCSGISTATTRTMTVPNASGTLAVSTLASFQDSTLNLYDNSDNTKIGNFQLSGITTGQSRTLTFPDASGTIVIQGDAFLGLGGATGDTTNRLSVNSGAILFNRYTDDVQVKLNKQAAGDDSSFLFQTNFSGRAEIGCIGDDNFQFKTSTDGSTFYTGLTLVAAAEGVPKVPSFTVANLPTASTAGAGALSFCTDETGGAVLVFSDGTNWRRVTDRAIAA